MSTQRMPMKRDLATCERVIDRGLDGYMAVGSAFAEIRDEKLYRRTHSSFEAYVEHRWGLSISRAYQMIEAAETSTIVDVSIANEAQARAIGPTAKSDPDAANEIMAEVHAEAEETGEPVTAAKIADKVKAREVPPAGVDPTTGEIAAELDELLANDPDIARAVWQRDFGKSISRPLALMGYDPADAAEQASDDQAEEIARLIVNLLAWHDKFTKARPSGLRLVGGTK